MCFIYKIFFVNKFKLNLLQTAKKVFGYRLSAFSLAAKSGYQQKINVEISYIIKWLFLCKRWIMLSYFIVILLIIAFIKYPCSYIYIKWKKIIILMCERNMFKKNILQPKVVISRKFRWIFLTLHFPHWCKKLIMLSCVMLVFFKMDRINYSLNNSYVTWKETKILMYKMSMFQYFSIPAISGYQQKKKWWSVLTFLYLRFVHRFYPTRNVRIIAWQYVSKHHELVTEQLHGPDNCWYFIIDLYPKPEIEQFEYLSNVIRNNWKYECKCMNNAI
jgi:hypothetical protein